MHLKSCCALLLLALVACQAAPSTIKNIEKSISEKTSKIEKDELNIEDLGLDKERAKKSTTFCVEVRDGTQQQVPCSEAKQSLVLVQPEPANTVISQPAYVEYPLKFADTPVQVIHPQPQQTIHVAPVHQPIHTVHVQQQPQPAPQPIHTVHVQPQPQPAPQPIQTVHIQPQPQPTPQPLPQPTVQPVIYMQPPYNLPAVQTPPAQAPIVNILTPPAAPCNTAPATTVVHEHVHEYEPVKEVEHFKPAPRPERLELEFKPKPVVIPQQHVEIMPVEAPCKQDVIVLPSKSLPLYPEKQLAVQVTELEPQTVSAADCICNQKGRPSWFRHHPKVHEHHVMLHPTGNMGPSSPMLVQPPCPLSYLSNNHPLMVGELPANTYGGDTVISVHQQRPYYPNAYPSLHPSASSGYVSYPVKTYDSQLGYTSPSVTVNAFPQNVAEMLRQAQSSPQKIVTANLNELGKEHRQSATSTVGTTKRETEMNNQQTNYVPKQSGEPSKTSLNLGEQKNVV